MTRYSDTVSKEDRKQLCVSPAAITDYFIPPVLYQSRKATEHEVFGNLEVCQGPMSSHEENMIRPVLTSIREWTSPISSQTQSGGHR